MSAAKETTLPADIYALFLHITTFCLTCRQFYFQAD
jgi:hypothetical protein